MEVLERVIKRENTDLTERNAELFKENQTLKEKHDTIKDRNRDLIRENMKLYRQLRILRLKLKGFESLEEKKTSLDTLANLATTIIDVTEPPTQSSKVRRSARTRTATSKKV
jgi:FtsZ-binding cell division protein ZapB